MFIFEIILFETFKQAYISQWRLEMLTGTRGDANAAGHLVEFRSDHDARVEIDHKSHAVQTSMESFDVSSTARSENTVFLTGVPDGSALPSPPRLAENHEQNHSSSSKARMQTWQVRFCGYHKFQCRCMISLMLGC